MVEEAVLAEQVGLSVYGVGEHHRPDTAVSAPAVVLSTIAGRTEHIRLSSAVAVLSSAEPVRVFQDFVTLDLLSSGRAELMAGPGSFTESFPLFGHSLGDDDALFLGHPERVADKVVALTRALGLQRFEMHAPHVGHAETMRSIELVGTQVAPLVAERLAA